MRWGESRYEARTPLDFSGDRSELLVVVGILRQHQRVVARRRQQASRDFCGIESIGGGRAAPARKHPMQQLVDHATGQRFDLLTRLRLQPGEPRSMTREFDVAQLLDTRSDVLYR